MAAERLHVAVIAGSVRAGRIAPAVANWAAAQLDHHDDSVTGTAC